MRGFRVRKEDFILRQLEPKSQVLHIGCTNFPNTLKRWNSGALLHKTLVDQARTVEAEVVGIDIDDEGIGFLRRRMPEAVILNVDAHHLSGYFTDRRFDLIIGGDVIEHLPNPGLFLKSCSDVLSDNGRLVVTTPSAFSIVRFLKAFLFHEAVHEEHTAYYSHKTLGRLMRISDLTVSDFGYYRCEPAKGEYRSLSQLLGNTIESVACTVFPQFSEGIVAIAHRTTAGSGAASMASNAT